MRTFVAVELDKLCQEKIALAIEKLKDVAGKHKWVRPADTHLTLKFIGDVSKMELPNAIAAIEAAANRVDGFQMTLRGISGFPTRGQPRVIHIAVEEPTGKLKLLAEEVEDRLASEVGVKRETRGFKPHVTIGRRRKGVPCPSVQELRDAVQDENFGTVRVESIVLMESKLTPEGPIYTPVKRFKLG
jgi:2'-5' RNA ligase